MAMITETKTPTLIPKPDQTAESARDIYFGAKYPPETNGDLPGYSPSAAVSEESKTQAEMIKSTRKKEKKHLLRRVANYGAAVIAAAGIGGATTEVAQLLGNTEHPPYLKQHDHGSTRAHR
jgi:hypothetical protein